MAKKKRSKSTKVVKVMMDLPEKMGADGRTEEFVLTSISNPDPRPGDNPVYELRTLQDIYNAIDNENIDGFLSDFEGWLRGSIVAKMIMKDACAMSNLPEDSYTLEMACMRWIDDHKRPTDKPTNPQS